MSLITMAMPKSKFMKRSQEHDSTCCRPPTDSASVPEGSSEDAYAQRSISCLSSSMTLARTTPNEACAMCRSRGIGQAMCGRFSRTCLSKTLPNASLISISSTDSSRGARARPLTVNYSSWARLRSWLSVQSPSPTCRISRSFPRKTTRGRGSLSRMSWSGC